MCFWQRKHCRRARSQGSRQKVLLLKGWGERKKKFGGKNNERINCGFVSNAAFCLMLLLWVNMKQTDGTFSKASLLTLYTICCKTNVEFSVKKQQMLHLKKCCDLHLSLTTSAPIKMSKTFLSRLPKSQQQMIAQRTAHLPREAKCQAGVGKIRQRRF